MIMKSKRCGVCKMIKSLDEFARRSDRPSGRISRCKECDKEKAKAYYAANRERKAAYYAARNRELSEERAEARALIRKMAEAVYGALCEWCGATDELEFDHVNDDGAEHRKRESDVTYVRRIARTGARLPDVDLRLLCVPCHRGPGWRERRAARAS